MNEMNFILFFLIIFFTLGKLNAIYREWLMQSYRTNLIHLSKINFMEKLDETSWNVCSLICLRKEECVFFSFHLSECRFFNGGERRPTEDKTGPVTIFNLQSGLCVKNSPSESCKLVDCRPDELNYKGTCIYFGKTKKHPPEARKACKERKQTLISVETEDKNNFLKTHGLDASNAGIIIGLQDEETEGTFVWESTGKKASMSCCWEGSEPNSLSGNEDDVALQKHTGRWIDVGSSYKGYFACESKPYV